MERDLVIECAQVEDAEEILALQKLAYQSEAALVNDYTIPPLTQTLEDITAQFADQVFVKGMLGKRIIGSARAYQDQGTCFVGRVIVHPDCQNQGIGSRIMDTIEHKFPDAQRFELFTGSKSERNLFFYQKLGYRIFKKEALNEKVELVFLEKLKSYKEE